MLKSGSMNRENEPILTYKLVEFEKYLVQIQDFKKMIDPFWGVCRIFLNVIKKSQQMSKCNWVVLKALGSLTNYVQKSP